MVDCAEGTQFQMRRYKVSMQKLEHIFISHLHGDHWFGLIGMLSSMALLDRTREIHIHAPEQLRSTLNHLLQNYCHDMPYNIVFDSVDTSQHAMIHQDRAVEVWSMPLIHTIPCCGFLFKEKQGARHVIARAIETWGIPVWAINGIKAGADWTTEDGQVIPNDKLTTPPTPSRSYAYCSDTQYAPHNAALMEGVNLLYHEATYGDDKTENAAKYCHSTARQAGMMAAQAHAQQLLIGHFSHRYNDETVLLEQAKQEFANTILAKEGLKINIS